MSNTRIVKKYIIIQVLLIATILAMGKLLKPDYYYINIESNNNLIESKVLKEYEKYINKRKYLGNKYLKVVFNNNNNPNIENNINLKNNKVTINGSIGVDKSVSMGNLNKPMAIALSNYFHLYNKKYPETKLKALKALDIIVSSVITKKPIRGNQYFDTTYYTNQTIVKTGIAVDKIYNIDLPALTYSVRFYLWFKWDSDLTQKEVSNVLLTNTNDNAILATYKDYKSIKSVIAIKESKGYIKYLIDADLISNDRRNYTLGYQELLIGLKHKSLDYNSIVYQFDHESKNNGLYYNTSPKNKKEMAQAKYEVINNKTMTLDYNLAYTVIANKLDYGYRQKTKLISELYFQYTVKNILFSGRGVASYINNLLGNNLNEINTINIYIISIIIISFILWLSFTQRFLISTRNGKIISFILKPISILALLVLIELMASEIVYSLKFTTWGFANLNIANDLMKILNYTVGCLWWGIPAYYVNQAFSNFLYEPIEEKTKTEIPKVLKLFASSIIYALAVIGIMAYVFEVTTNSLMATSGAFAILFAIMSKVDVTNIVAGLGISFAKVFKLGDWVRIGSKEGKVIEMTARATKLKTFDQSIINIPNSDVGSAIIENLSESTYRLYIHLEVVPREHDYIENVLLKAVSCCTDIVSNPPPFISFLGQGDSAMIYEVYFFISDYSKRASTTAKVWQRVWKACEDNSIEMATPQREHFNFDMDKRG